MFKVAFPSIVYQAAFERESSINHSACFALHKTMNQVIRMVRVWFHKHCLFSIAPVKLQLRCGWSLSVSYWPGISEGYRPDRALSLRSKLCREYTLAGTVRAVNEKPTDLDLSSRSKPGRSPHLGRLEEHERRGRLQIQQAIFISSFIYKRNVFK